MNRRLPPNDAPPVDVRATAGTRKSGGKAAPETLHGSTAELLATRFRVPKSIARWWIRRGQLSRMMALAPGARAATCVPVKPNNKQLRTNCARRNRFYRSVNGSTGNGNRALQR